MFPTSRFFCSDRRARSFIISSFIFIFSFSVLPIKRKDHSIPMSQVNAEPEPIPPDRFMLNLEEPSGPFGINLPRRPLSPNSALCNDKITSCASNFCKVGSFLRANNSNSAKSGNFTSLEKLCHRASNHVLCRLYSFSSSFRWTSTILIVLPE